MKNDMRSIHLFLALCLFFAGCRDSVISTVHPSQGGKVPVQLVVAGIGSPSRTIAPEHVSMQDLVDSSKYTVTLTGTSNMGDRIDLNPARFSHGMLGLDLSPGIWSLHLQATDVQTNKQVLSGSCVLVVQSKPVSVTVTLTPISGGNGTVAVSFVLSKSILEKLDKTSNQATITVALYDTQKQEVPNTREVFRPVVPTMGDSVTLRYTAAGAQLPTGWYTVKLESTYTVQNGSTQNQPVVYEMGYEDFLYVEGNRNTVDSIEFSSNSKELGIPWNPYLRDKYSLSGNSKTNNFMRVTSFTPWKETLWLYGDCWDEEGDGSVNGNEVLVINWEAVYNADFYEVELLFHPFPRIVGGGVGGTNPNPYGKIETVVYTDDEWEILKQKQFTSNNVTKTPSYLRFSGSSSDPNYYKTHYSTINFVSGTNYSAEFLTCADKTLAKRIFTDSAITNGKGNNGYRPSGTTIWDTNGVYTYSSRAIGQIGLEGGCSVLGILVPSFAPRISVVYRVRAVNAYGHSDWVYWKGGVW